MRISDFSLAFFSVGLALWSYSAPAPAETVNVAVASNFVTTLEDIAMAFEEASEHEVRIIRGSSGKHYAQISNGAPFDVFLSADSMRPARLLDAGRAISGTLHTYALGQLALYSRSEGVVLSREYLENTDNYKTIAMANARLAPYGQAALQVLERLGIESQLQGRIVVGENIAQAFQFVFSGNADLGLVAHTQTLQPQLESRGTAWLLPAELYEPIRQDMVLLSESVGSRAFMRFMQSKQARDILIKNGYLLPELKPSP